VLVLVLVEWVVGPRFALFVFEFLGFLFRL